MKTTLGNPRRRGDYRVFVGAFPTGEIARRIQGLREASDPKTARITDPHVTLAGTYWRHGPATADNEAETIANLEAACSAIEPFELVLGGVQSFLPLSAVVYLDVRPTDGLLAARQVLLEVLGRDKHRRFVPHLTLAMRLGRRRSRALLTQLRQTEWHDRHWAVPVDKLWFMQRGPGDPAWRYLYCLALNDRPRS
jgi:2'-5' RNA ligase